MNGEVTMTDLGTTNLNDINPSEEIIYQFEGLIKPNKILGICFPRTTP
jgi:hypothetical protein